MKSATGNLVIWVGLLILDVSGIAARALMCKPVGLAALVERQIHEMIQDHDRDQPHIRPKPLEMPELRMNASLPEEQRARSALCALGFMEEALRQVFHHRNKLDIDAVLLTDVVRKVEKHLKPCVEDALRGKCEERHSKPRIPVKHFQAKQWTRAVLERSREFLKHLGVFLKETTEQHH